MEGIDPFFLHGFLMWFSWGILGFLMIVSNRYLKSFWRIHLWIHIICGSLIFIITGAMGLFALNKMGWIIESNLHSLLGVTLFILVGFIVLGGVATKLSLVNTKWKTRGALAIKVLHRNFGIIMIFVS